MKADKRLMLLFAVVAAQLVWLAWNYVDRTRELANAPGLLIDCTDYDPRDLFRGDYVSLSATQTVPLELAGRSIHWDADFCKRVNTHYEWDSDKKEQGTITNQESTYTLLACHSMLIRPISILHHRDKVLLSIIRKTITSLNHLIQHMNAVQKCVSKWKRQVFLSNIIIPKLVLLASLKLNLCLVRCQKWQMLP